MRKQTLMPKLSKRLIPLTLKLSFIQNSKTVETMNIYKSFYHTILMLAAFGIKVNEDLKHVVKTKKIK